MERKVFRTPMRPFIITAVVVLLFQVITGLSSARTLPADTAQPVHKLTVAVTAHFGDGTLQAGFGFIIAKDPHFDSVDIVTPNHVVRMAVMEESHVIGWEKPDTIWVSFFRGHELNPVKMTARLLEKGDPNKDMAFIRTKPPVPLGLKLLEVVAHPRMYRQNSNVWYVGKWENNEAFWYVPQNSGILVYPDTLAELVARGLDVKPGRSGAPLYVDSGVVGIITEAGNDVFYARPMLQVASFAKTSPSINYMLKDYEWFSFAPKWYLGFGTGIGQMSAAFIFVDTVYPDPWDPFYFEVQSYEFDLEESGQGANARIARGLRNNFLLGADIDVFWFEFDDESGDRISFNLSNMSFSLSYYLSNSFYIRGGPAVSVGWVKNEDTGVEIASEEGYGFTIGGGAQIKIGQRWFLVPSLSYNSFDLETVDGTFLNMMGGLIYTW